MDGKPISEIMLQQLDRTKLIEPHRIKVVEPIYITTELKRRELLTEAHLNPFLLKARHVIIDALTDSGVTAMSAAQWGALMMGDESYAGANSWFEFEHVVKNLTGYPYVLPTHQGRAAESILYGHLGGPGKVFISNTHFDTTRANIEYSGAKAFDCPCKEFLEDSDIFPFQGNMDLVKLEEIIQKEGQDKVAGVILTVTNNTGGGQPLSMENAKAVKRMCDKYGSIPLFLDSCRIAENAWFIKNREKGYQNYTYKGIAKEMFSLANGAVMSAKKDGLSNVGGFLALRDEQLADACMSRLIITEGYTTYGGLSGRDMEAIAVGLEEVFQEEYLNYRILSTAYLGQNLHDIGVPVVLPIGGHAVYVDAREMLPHIPVEQYPGQALVCQLYIKGGIRACEIGSVMFGKNDANGKLIPAEKELVRLAIPRRVYTKSHADYVIKVFKELMENTQAIRGIKITHEPKFLRHFTAHFEEVE